MPMHTGGKRRWQRLPANIPIVVVVGMRRTGGTVVDLSRTGARLCAPGDLEPGTQITLMGDRLGALDARIVWSRGDTAGVEFAEAAPDVMAQLRSILDELTDANARRPQLPPPGPQFGRRTELAGKRN